MKLSCTSLGLALTVVTVTAWAQDYPEVTADNENLVLSIPYFELDDEEGETSAYAVDLFAPLGGDLAFFVELESLIEVEENQPETIEGEGACSMTTDAQTNACEAGVKNDYFIAMAVCFNVSDEEDRADCMDETLEEREEGFEECDDVEEAREQLCGIFGEDPYDPEIDPENFLSPEQIALDPNPYLPLVTGNQWIYEAEDETITVTVLDETREILGIEAVVVRDVVEEEGELVEDTHDWFAQDVDGNIWYMGEIALNYEDGELSDIDGSWEAGVDGAKPGILFRAVPVVGETLRQEYLIGEAEDIGRTVSLTADESTEAGYDCEGSCLLTLEGTPLELDALENKYYLPGVGHILTIDLEEGGREELVDFISGD